MLLQPFEYQGPYVLPKCEGNPNPKGIVKSKFRKEYVLPKC